MTDERMDELAVSLRPFAAALIHEARKERDVVKAMASELEKDLDYCEKQWHEALATHENIEALKSRIAELEAALRDARSTMQWHTDMTRPIGRTADAIAAIDKLLKD